MLTRYFGRLSFGLIFLTLAGCRLANGPFEPVPSVVAPAAIVATVATEQPSPTAITPVPSATPPIPDSGWQLLRPGLERRLINLGAEDGRLVESLYLLRLEPARYQFDIAYSPGEPRSLTQWQADSGALIVVNGGYFTPEHTATGLIVSAGQANGVSYGPFAGMLAVTAAGPELRWLAERPYDPAEPLQAALQSFPLLVKPGGLLGYPEEDGQPARRTVVGQDGEGRILFILATRGDFTLHALSRYLTAGDLGLDIALNLDGGTSTGLILADPLEQIPAFVLLPLVILVYER